jgi:hypothetical protein
MPVQVELMWDNRVVLQTFTDPLNSQQLIDLRAQMGNVIFPATTDKLHVIVDVRQVKHLPSTTISSVTGLFCTRHPNTGLIICIATNTFIVAVLETLNRLLPQHPLTVISSLEAALELIRPTLQSVNA